MKIKSLIFTSLLAMAPLANANDYSSSVTLTLSDIKEALYGLLMDTRSNSNSIYKIIKSNAKMYKDISIEKKDNNTSFAEIRSIITSNKIAVLDNNKTILKNDAAIKKINNTIIFIMKDISKLEEDKILYKEYLEKFVNKNKNLLNEKK